MGKKYLHKHLINVVITVTAIALILLTAMMIMVSKEINVPPEGVAYDFARGTSLKVLARDLNEKNIIKYPRAFELYVRINGEDKYLHAGEYHLQQGISAYDVIHLLIDGKVMQHPLKIVEGSNVYNLKQSINCRDNIKHDIDFNDKNWMYNVCEIQHKHAEGFFMPDTYLYTKNASAESILKRAHDAMHKFLDKAWQERSDSVNYKSPYDALIVASIVEKETSVPEERERIAGVLVRRLAKNMRLQMDPTVIYGIGPDFNGNITKKNLQTDTPYNTYTRAGLPPTPIAMPSRESIIAALNPNEGDCLYFVARGDGSHVFTSTLEEHNKAVVKYILKSDQQEPVQDAVE